MDLSIKKILTAALVSVLMCGCAAIPDKPTESTSEATADASETDEATSEAPPPEESAVKGYDIEKSEKLIKLNAEGGSFSGIVRTEGDYDGNGYVMLDEGTKLVHMAEDLTSQHYRIAISAYSYSGAAITLTTAEGIVGVFHIPPSESADFSMYAIDSVYLAEGPSLFTFQMTEGSAAMDYIVIENADAAPDTCYRTAVSVVGKNTGINTISTMKYLSDSYGKRVLTAQNVTPGTNAEIDAVHEETGRYPAIRCGDLMYSSSYADEKFAETAEKEIELALQWGRDSGIISMGWHWFSPVEYGSDFYSDGTSFDLDDAVTEYNIASSDIEEIEGMYESGMITENCLLLIKDIDRMAEVLSRFKKEFLTVIWQPLPDGDTGLYWWGGNAESYRWLWNVMFERMNSYHGLNNLIWVWNGTDPQFYPGDDVCDIVGHGSYLNSSASFAGVFSALAHISPTDTKPVAITGCDRLPDPGMLRRDNAMWLWTASAGGSYTIREDGSINESYNNWQRLNDTYNSLMCVTRDELPDMSTYGIEYMDDELSSVPETADITAE